MIPGDLDSFYTGINTISYNHMANKQYYFITFSSPLITQPEVFLNLSTTGFEITNDAGILQASVLLPNSLLQTVADNIDRCQFVLYQDTTFFEVTVT